MPDYYDYEFIYPFLRFGTGFYIFTLAITALSIVAMWMMFEKAGEPGWASLIPFYNLYVLYKITWGNGWYFLLLLIPIARIVIAIITCVKLSNAFGKGGGFACGLIFLNTIFMCILAFDKQIQYVGVSGQTPPAGGYGGGYNQNGFQNPYSQEYQQRYQQNNYQQGNYQQNNYSQDYQQNSYQQPPREQQQSAENPQYYYQTTQNTDTQKTDGQHFCPECGEKLLDTDKFCPKCGKKQEF